MIRMFRDEEKKAFVCRACGLETRRVNGEDMFDRTAPTVGFAASTMDGNASNRHANPEAWDNWVNFCAGMGYD